MRLALRYSAAFSILIAAFGVGICLGKLPFSRDREETLAQFRKKPVGSAEEPPSLESPAERPLELLPDPVRRAQPKSERLHQQSTQYWSPEPWDVVHHPGDGFRLRMRSVERLSSNEVCEGAPVTFVTEHAIIDASGGVVPAGSTVEGIIAQASSATKAESGRMVIKIHTIRVGTRLFTLDALPFAQDADKDGDDRGETAAANSQRDNSPGIASLPALPDNLHTAPAWLPSGPTKKQAMVMEWTNLAPSRSTTSNREAVLPKEAILEFELLQRPNRETIVPTVTPPVPHKPDRDLPFSKPAPNATPATPA